MRLFIRVVDGSPINHPIMENNFKAAFPSIDIDNLPEGFAEFERVRCPAITVFQKSSKSYELVDGKYKDVWVVEEMSDSEKSEVIEEARALPHIELWEFDETIPGYIPGNIDLDSDEPDVAG